MRALTVSPPQPGARISDVPVPEMVPGGVRVRVLECGVCGTDRDIVHGAYGTPAAGKPSLILGHENFGQVIEVSDGVEGFGIGDYVVATVRRGCGACHMCLHSTSDLCETGTFTERGIRGRDGYMAEQYVEVPEYLVKVPRGLRDVAVLTEPLTVVEKAVQIGQSQLRNWENPKEVGNHPTPFKALVAGTGAIGILAALLLKSMEFEVVTIDRHGSDTPAAQLLMRAGIRHRNTSEGLEVLQPDGPFHLGIEATGSAELAFSLPRYLAPNAALVLTGIPAGEEKEVPV